MQLPTQKRLHLLAGRSNPAHTGCEPAETPPTTPPQTPPPSTKTDVPPPPPGGGAPQAPAPQVATAAEADELAFTGFDVLPLGLGGLALVGAGGAAVLMARRTKRS